MTRRAALAGLGLGLGLGLSLAACREERYLEERVVPPRTGERIPVQTSGILAGVGEPPPRARNPFEGNVHAIRDGQRYYRWFNCLDCHGAIGGGSMGPPLRDQDWIYGGDPAQIYRSIVEGRPQGMPSYRSLPDDVVWKLVAYVSTLGPREERDVAP